MLMDGVKLIGYMQSLHNRLDQMQAVLERLEEQLHVLQENNMITFNVHEQFSEPDTQAASESEWSDDDATSVHTWP